ncbi:MAG TPA: YegP family protein, partial [Saprospiraceae bacterium]|nr:YegP family protein [Saprospiraceae bacterium]
MSDSNKKIGDDYLPCSAYQGSVTDENGFHRFEEAGEFYFSVIDHGIVVLRSEGYASESGRENGIASVLKNIQDEDKYGTKQLEDGSWVLVLKAGNHQEIARSCPEETEEEAKSYLPSSRAAFAAEFLRLASVEAGS